MDIVKIRWIDASYSSSVWSRHELLNFELTTIETIGWLAQEKQDCYILATDYYMVEETFRHVCAIPKIGIVEITKLRKR